PHAQSSVFLFKQPAPTELYTLSLHDALPILAGGRKPAPRRHATIFAVPTVQRPSLRFTIARDVRSLRRHNKLTGCPCRAFQPVRSEEHTSELQSRSDLVCRLLLEKKKKKNKI